MFNEGEQIQYACYIQLGLLMIIYTVPHTATECNDYHDRGWILPGEIVFYLMWLRVSDLKFGVNMVEDWAYIV